MNNVRDVFGIGKGRKNQSLECRHRLRSPLVTAYFLMFHPPLSKIPRSAGFSWGRVLKVWRCPRLVLREKRKAGWREAAGSPSRRSLLRISRLESPPNHPSIWFLMFQLNSILDEETIIIPGVDSHCYWNETVMLKILSSWNLQRNGLLDESYKDTQSKENVNSSGTCSVPLNSKGFLFKFQDESRSWLLSPKSARRSEIRYTVLVNRDTPNVHSSFV